MYTLGVRVTFNWIEFLTLAENLVGNPVTPNQEAKLRCAISRAYFGAYCRVRNFLRDIEGETFPRTAEAHQKVCEILDKSSDIRRKQISQNLQRLRLDRNKADYKDTFTGLSRSSSAAISLAKQVNFTLGKI